MGFSAKQVIPILNDVGNAVAAVGGNKEILDRVILALSQMQAKGRVATQEINQLAEAGIPAWRLLSESIGKSTAETIKLAEQGQISSEVFLQAFQKFSQTNFGGMMEKQSRTFSGAMSNIKDSLSQTAATAFEPLFNKISEISDRISQEMQNGKPTFEKSLTAMLSGGTEIVAGIGEQIGEALINNIIEGIKNPRESIPRVLRNAFAVPIGIFNAVKNEVLPEPSGSLTKPIPVPDLAPVPLPANTLSTQQSALDGTNKTAEKTADILERVKDKLFSVGDASTYAATKQALLRAGVTDLNTGLAAQALKLAAAGDAAQAFADKQQAETDRVFSRNQDIAAQLLEVSHRATEGF
jgi:tape measure domain-containing protein